MANKTALTIAFLEKRPVQAANTLSEMDVDDAAAFLDTLPTRTVTRVMSQMGTSMAAVLLDRMDPPKAAATLRVQDYLLSAAILRLIPAEDRAPILEHMPERLRRNFQTSLSFPHDTVGARMTSSIVMLGRDDTISDAHAQIRRSTPALTEAVFVVGKDRKLVGTIRAGSLLRHAGRTALSEVMEVNIAWLSARARLSSIADVAAWDRHNALPVLSRHRHLIGALRRDAVRQYSAPPGQATNPDAQSIMAPIADALLATAVGIGDLLSEGAAHSQSPGRREKRS